MKRIFLSLVNSNLAPTLTSRCGAASITNYLGGALSHPWSFNSMRQIGLNLCIGASPCLLGHYAKVGVVDILSRRRNRHIGIMVISDDKEKQTFRRGNPQTPPRINRGGVTWIDGYNNAVHRDFVTTLKTNTDTSNLYFFNDTRKTNSNKPI